MRGASGWSTRGSYAKFLTLQYAARHPVEAWLSEHAPAKLCPPPQCPQLASDLAALGKSVPRAGRRFSLPDCEAHRSDYAFIGAAWVLAGSSLGNRAILKDITRDGHGQWPDTFLSDDTMLAFWKQLRPIIETPTRCEHAHEASAAAIAVFDHFIAQITSNSTLCTAAAA